MTRRMLAVFTLGLALVACGGDDAVTTTAEAAAGDTTTTAGDGQTPAATTQAPETTAAPASGGDGTPDVGIAENTAVFEIGDNRYEIDVTPGAIQRCDPDFFGIFWALGTNEETVLTMELVPESMTDRVTQIEVTDKVNDLEWVADPENLDFGIQPGQSQVDSWQVDGRAATGTATFIEQNAVFAAAGGSADFPEPVQGTFTVLCAEEG